MTETTAWGAAALAGLGVGFWRDLDELAAVRQVDCRFIPAMDTERRADLLRGWHRAVELAAGWARPYEG